MCLTFLQRCPERPEFKKVQLKAFLQKHRVPHILQMAKPILSDTVAPLHLPLCMLVCVCGEPPRCRAIWTGPALRGGARAVDGRQVLEPGDDQARPPPSLHLYLPCPNEPEGGRERPAEGGQLTEERCPQGEARNKRCSRHRCQAATT
ncbi:hypothetical protein AALO_G00069620 [Alosa alosa]|uniref:Uncharacterized protein n=1 Tax=Alosa alosa TaxID=278164 RepID=A0AAV6H1S4_9TELE|nr:hypothetical protein AALO_G00069620 [Alosa alosa]